MQLIQQQPKGDAAFFTVVFIYALKNTQLVLNLVKTNLLSYSLSHTGTERNQIAEIQRHFLCLSKAKCYDNYHRGIIKLLVR